MKKNEPKPAELTTMGMSPAQFGAALINEAQARKQKERLEKSVIQTQAVLSSLEECDLQILYFQGWKKTRLAQLEALKAGEFTFDLAGSIVYNDKALNRK